ncbi:MAG TPA: hypothetical protein VI197_21525 [Polyangiaceae bacterium]
MVRRFDDDDGQDDGDGWSVGASRGVQFAKGMQAQPWLRGNSPPWHLWGNTQRLTVPIQLTGAGVDRSGTTNQLLRISYKRPETWHWLFHARLVSGPANTAGFFSTITVSWELATGIGRSAVRMFAEGAPYFAIPPFERFDFRWGPVNTAFPVGAHIWSTQSTAPTRFFNGDGPFTEGPPVTEIVGQDIQLQVQLQAVTVPANVAAVGQTCTLEVSAMFSPKNHVRPDWFFNKAAIEQQFPGDEVGGT